MSARRIYVVGIRTCTPLAQFLGFYLNLLFDDVTIVTTNSASEIFEQMINVNNEDVVIGISFPRYSMRTLKAMEFANDRNAKVISITDDKNSPLNLYSSCNLLAKSDMATVVDSLVAPLSVINALVVTLCMKKPDYVTGKLDMLDKLWEDYQVYSGDEMNIPDGKVAITSTGTSEE
jgi:DNA-binding MurR/RpiR family transcriptional regulator